MSEGEGGAGAAALNGGNEGGTQETTGGEGGGQQQPVWHESLDPDQRGYLENKQWLKDDPTESLKDVLSGYQNLSKVMGADKEGRAIVKPKEDASEEELNAFAKQLGWPSEPDGYSVPEELKDDPLVKEYKEFAHKERIPAQYAEKVVNWFVEHAQGMQATNDAQFEKQSEEEFNTLKQEWGARADTNTELFRRGARAAFPDLGKEELGAQMEKIERAIGTKAMMSMMVNLMKGSQEHEFIQSGKSAGPTGMSQEAAKARIQEIKRDHAQVQKILNGDAAANKEWKDLHIAAAGE